MKINTSYSIKIKHYNHIFKDTACLYRKAVDFFIVVVLQEWDNIHSIHGVKAQKSFTETLTVATKAHPFPKYGFGKEFYKFPSYLRRAAISEAIGKIREHLKSLPVTARLDIEAKVPQCTKRNTCTLSSLISLNAVLAAN